MALIYNITGKNQMPTSRSSDNAGGDSTFPQPYEVAKRKLFNYDPTVNLGHLISFVAAVLMVMAAWTSLDKRVVVLEEGRKVQESQDRMQDQRADMSRQDLKETLTEVKRGVEKLGDKLDRIDSTPRQR